MACQDVETGGFSDRPNDMPDPFHTLFGLAGLSLLGEPSLKTINPVFCMPQSIISHLKVQPQTLTIQQAIKTFSIRTLNTMGFCRNGNNGDHSRGYFMVSDTLVKVQESMEGVLPRALVCKQLDLGRRGEPHRLSWAHRKVVAESQTPISGLIKGGL